jgi:hypothetical protein
MQSGFDGERQERMPGRVKFHFVDAMTVTVESAQHRRMEIGGKAKPYRLRLAQSLAKRTEFVRRPAGFLARYCLAKHAVGLQEIVRFERRRLVSDWVHRCVFQR